MNDIVERLGYIEKAGYGEISLVAKSAIAEIQRLRGAVESQAAIAETAGKECGRLRGIIDRERRATQPVAAKGKNEDS